MDTSETYIKMADCPEIQEQRTKDNWEDGDRVIFIGGGKVHIHYTQNDAWADVFPWAKHRIEWLWLPRQDQLQEMADNEGKAHTLVVRLVNWLQSELWFDKDGFCNWKHAIDYDSMEQLWLAFVMKELHGKVWDGEVWTN